MFGISRGSFAEYAAAREDKLAHKPASLSFEQAAVVPVLGLTAIQGLRDARRVEAGQGGNSRLSRLRRALTATGTLVIVGGEEGGKLIGGIDRPSRALVLLLFVRQRLTMLISNEHHADLEALTKLIEAGHVMPVIDAIYRLAEVPTPCGTSRPDTREERSPSRSDPRPSPSASSSSPEP